MESFPEEKLAERVIKKYNLVPPINIRVLIQEYAQLEEDDIPDGVDAICIKSNGHPHIILNRNIPNVRKRFTLAHELGHIIIPWHIGTLTTHIDGFQTFEDSLYKTVEAEANRFASKLLMPIIWIEKIIKKNNEDIEAMISLIQENAIVSLPSACIALLQQLKPGYLIFVLQDDEVQYSFQSPDTAVHIPISSTFDDQLYSQFSSKNGSFDSGSYEVFWYKYDHSIETKLNCVDSRLSSEILRDIIKSFIFSQEIRLHKIQCINGIIGSANNSILSSKESLYQRLKERMSGRPEIRDIISHPDFNNFLIKKAEEITKRKQNTRP